MSIGTIPPQILTHNAVFRIPTADAWGDADWQEYPVFRVAVQPTHRVVIGKDAKERQLVSVLYYDCRVSSGAESLEEWQAMAETQNKEIEVVALGRTYRIASIDWLYDDEGRPHHWEVGLC